MYAFLGDSLFACVRVYGEYPVFSEQNIFIHFLLQANFPCHFFFIFQF